MNEYAHIKNQEEVLEAIARERAVSGGMSRLEKIYIDRLLAAPAFEDIDADAITPRLHLGFQMEGFPATPEEIYAFVSEAIPLSH